MKELKSKLTGRTSQVTEAEYAEIVTKGVIDLKKFIVTDIRVKQVVPSLKIPDEVKKIKKTKE